MAHFLKIILLFALFSSDTFADSWLKGDLHVHTTYSGGDSNVRELSNVAQSLGLDFIAITDHDDKMNGVPKAWPEISKLKSKTTVLYGMEWTHGVTWATCKGHMNLWSARPFDYKKIWAANEADNANEAQLQAENQGVLFSINHPKIFGFEWEYDFSDHLPAVEIWNGMFEVSSSRDAINDVWNAYFKRGIKVTGVGGSDVHSIRGTKSALASMGNPTTWVYAKENSGTAVLEAIKKGRALISFAPDSPVALIRADADLDRNYESFPGDDISPVKNFASFNIEILGSREGSGEKSVVLFKNGNPYRTWDVSTKKIIKFVDRIQSKERAWYHVELHGETGFSIPQSLLYGDMLSISNPITLNF